MLGVGGTVPQWSTSKICKAQVEKLIAQLPRNVYLYLKLEIFLNTGNMIFRLKGSGSDKTYSQANNGPMATEAEQVNNAELMPFFASFLGEDEYTRTRADLTGVSRLLPDLLCT